MTPDYSPRGIGKVLDDAVALYRAEFRTLAVPAAYVILPLALFTALAEVFLVRLVFSTALTPTATPGVGDLLQVFAAESVAISGVTLLGLASIFFGCAVWNSAPRVLARLPVQPREFLRGGWRRFGWVLLAGIAIQVVYSIGLLLTVLGTFLFVLPGLVVFGFTLYLLALLSMSLPIVVLEGASVDVALRRSVTLVRGNFWRTARLWFGMSVVLYALEAAVGSFSGIGQFVAFAGGTGLTVGLPWQVAAGVLQGIGSALAAPVTYLAWMLFYLDLRARKEGIDLIVRATALATPAP